MSTSHSGCRALAHSKVCTDKNTTAQAHTGNKAQSRHVGSRQPTRSPDALPSLPHQTTKIDLKMLVMTKLTKPRTMKIWRTCFPWACPCECPMLCKTAKKCTSEPKGLLHVRLPCRNLRLQENILYPTMILTRVIKHRKSVNTHNLFPDLYFIPHEHSLPTPARSNE